MSKERARKRAKARAANKTAKRPATAELPGQKDRPGQFDPGAGTIKGPGADVNAKNVGAVRRGAARSN